MDFYVRLSKEDRLALLEWADWNPDGMLETIFQSMIYALLSYADVPYELIIIVMAQARKHRKDADADASAAAVVDKIQQLELILQNFLHVFKINDTIDADLDMVNISPDVSLPLCSMDIDGAKKDAKWGTVTFLSGVAVGLPAAAAIEVLLDKILGCNMELSLGVFRHLKGNESILVSHLYWIVQNEVKRTPVSESPHLTDAIKFLRRAGLMP